MQNKRTIFTRKSNVARHIQRAPQLSGRERGFSLLEILVAFAILALSIGVLLNIFSRGLRTAIISEEYQQALAIAESQMARAGVEIPLAEGAASGDVDGKYTWSIVGSPYVLPTDQTNTQPAQITAFTVQVKVAWQDGVDEKQVVLNSVRLAKVPL
ncbi:MAG: type II secretion system protein [Methylococcaceae bacterium]